MSTFESTIQAAALAAQGGDLARAWEILMPHRGSVTKEIQLAWAWLVLLGQDPSPPAAADIVPELLESWPHNPDFVDLLARTLIGRIDGRTADDAVGEDDPAFVAAAVARRCLEALSEEHLADPAVGGNLMMTYGTALRLAGPAFDAEAERAFKRALATHPDHAPWLFNLGLLYKNRRRWSDALDLFARVRTLGGDDQPTLWNLAIAATAAGDGDAASEAWKALGLDVRRGADGLPTVEDLGRVKVRLSCRARPRAERPELEHVWVKAVSPCHGVVLNPTRAAHDADYGDLIVWDGSPIGWAREGKIDVPRFPMLARIRAGGVKKYTFLARQPLTGTVNALNSLLPDAVWIYVFDEEVRYVCQTCIETGGPHDASHAGDAPRLEPHVVEGALVVEPESDPTEARKLFEPLFAASPELTLAIPELYAALNDQARTAEHQALWARLSEARIANGGIGKADAG